MQQCSCGPSSERAGSAVLRALPVILFATEHFKDFHSNFFEFYVPNATGELHCNS